MRVIKPPEAVAILKQSGYKDINERKLQAGLRQRLFPFGRAIKLDKWVYDIDLHILMQWIEERRM